MAHIVFSGHRGYPKMAILMGNEGQWIFLGYSLDFQNQRQYVKIGQTHSLFISKFPIEQWLLNLCWLMTIGDNTTQYNGDYTNPIEESLQHNQYNGMREGF